MLELTQLVGYGEVKKVLVNPNAIEYIQKNNTYSRIIFIAKYHLDENYMDVKESLSKIMEQINVRTIQRTS